MNVEHLFKRITGHEKALAHFGAWPSFHDSEVVEITLERGGAADGAPELTMRVHAFISTDKVDAKGRFITEKHGVIVFRFSAVSELELSGFNAQNSLSELSFSDISGQNSRQASFEVGLDGSNGLNGSFLCQSIEIISIEKGIPAGSIYG